MIAAQSICFPAILHLCMCSATNDQLYKYRRNFSGFRSDLQVGGSAAVLLPPMPT
jgi:hypothetical protein